LDFFYFISGGVAMEGAVDDRLVGLREMARVLDVKPSFLYGLTRLHASGLPQVRVGKYVKFRPADVIRYFESTTAYSADSAMRFRGKPPPCSG